MKVFLAILVSMLVLFAVGCDSDDDVESDSADDLSGDDDAIDDDDDSDADDDDDSAADDDDDNDTADDDDNDTADDDDDTTSGEWIIEGAAARLGDLRIENVEGGIPGEDGAAIAVTPAGETIVAYANARFLYVARSGRNADGELVAPFARDPRLAVDDAGVTHMVYFDTWKKRVMYLTDASSHWASTPIESVDLSSPAALTLDMNGAVHLVYSPGAGGVQYATNATGEWRVETVSADRVGAPDIAVDSTGGVHIVGIVPSSRVVYATNASGEWETEIAANTPAVYSYIASVSIDVDSHETPHIAYGVVISISHSGNAVLYYATPAVIGWSRQQVPWSPPPLPYEWNASLDDIDLRIDDQDFAHIAYAYERTYLMGAGVARNVGGSWTKELLKTEAWDYDVFGHVGLALDGEGGEQVVVVSRGDASLSVYDEGASGWGRVVIDRGGQFGIGTTIAVGETGVHLAYAEWQNQTVRYARKNENRWSRERVAYQGIWYDQQIVRGNRIALDAIGKPHIAYAYFDEDNLSWTRYAVRNVIWTSENANAAGGGWRECVDLAMSPNGRAHIVFDTTLANYATNTSGQWEEFLLTPREIYGSAGSVMAVDADADGFPHILTDASREGFFGLAYATNRSGDWTLEEIPSTGLYELGWADIKIDPAGAAHVVYCGRVDSHASRVIYTTNAGGSWAMETIDESELTPPGIDACAIDLDSQNHPLVAYNYDRTYYSSKVKYAAKLGADWRKAFVDRADITGSFVDLAVGDDGIVHLAYYSEYAAWHAWFPKDFAEPNPGD